MFMAPTLAASAVIPVCGFAGVGGRPLLAVFRGMLLASTESRFSVRVRCNTRTLSHGWDFYPLFVLSRHARTLSSGLDK